MRTSSLLVSIVVHGTAIATVVAIGTYAMQQQHRPLAHLEIRQQEASAPAPQRPLPDPDVVPEEVVEDVVVSDVRVDQPEPVEDVTLTEPAKVDDRVLSPSEVLQGLTLEKVIKKPKPVPPKPVATPVAVAVETAVPKPSESVAFVQAQRSDNVEPVYPSRERDQMREGVVVVRVIVAKDGSVELAKLIKPSRYRGFNKSALAAARQWTFAPALRGGVAVKSETDIEVEFRLTDDG